MQCAGESSEPLRPRAAQCYFITVVEWRLIDRAVFAKRIPFEMHDATCLRREIDFPHVSLPLSLSTDRATAAYGQTVDFTPLNGTRERTIRTIVGFDDHCLDTVDRADGDISGPPVDGLRHAARSVQCVRLGVSNRRHRYGG